MRSLILVLFFLLLPSLSFAALPQYVWNTATGSFDPYVVANNRAMLQEADLALLNQLGRDGAVITRPASILGTAGGVAAADMYAAAGSGTAAVVLRKAIGLAGPVATVMTLAMTAKEIYDWAHASTANRAYFDGKSTSTTLTANSPPQVAGSVFQLNGNYYQVDYVIDMGLQGPVSTLPAPLPQGNPVTDVYHYIYYSGSGPYTVHTYRYHVFSTTAPVPPNMADQTFSTFADTLQHAVTTPDGATAWPYAKLAVDKAMSDSFADPAKVMAAPTPLEIANLGKIQTAADTAAAASQSLADQVQLLQDQLKAAQDKLAATPTDLALAEQAANLQRLLDQALADKAAADAEKAKEDALLQPAVPADNKYDSDIAIPDKKSITDLLKSFFSSSPLVSMVKSFAVTTSGATAVLHIGNIYGKDLSFDFTPWESILKGCGGVLIIIMHGYCVLVVVRGW